MGFNLYRANTMPGAYNYSEITAHPFSVVPWHAKPISEPSELETLLGSASWRDAASPMSLQMWSSGAYIEPGSERLPSPEDCLRCDQRSGFSYVSIRALKKSVRIADRGLKRGTIMLLDQASHNVLKDVYRLRIAHSEKEFAFHSLVEGAAINGNEPIDTSALTDRESAAKSWLEKTNHPYRHPEELVRKIVAEGMFSFLTSDMPTLRDSSELIGMIHQQKAEQLETSDAAEGQVSNELTARPN